MLEDCVGKLQELVSRGRVLSCEELRSTYTHRVVESQKGVESEVSGSSKWWTAAAMRRPSRVVTTVLRILSLRELYAAAQQAFQSN